jgi:hypothetical protein
MKFGRKLDCVYILFRIPKKGFLILLHALRFDNITDRQHRDVVYNLAPVRDMFERCVSDCQKNYNLVAMTTCWLQRKIQIPHMYAKETSKVWDMYALMDARVWYTTSLEIYVGKQPQGTYIYCFKHHI